jgi:hypothetical protein
MKRRSSCTVALAAALFCALAGSSMWAQSNQPSLAEVARRKPPHKAKVVITNDDIPPSREANSMPASTTAGTAAESSPAQEHPKDNAVASKLPPEKESKLQELLTERGNLEAVVKHLEDSLAEKKDLQAMDTLNEVLLHAKQELHDKQKQIDNLRTGQDGQPQTPAATSASQGPAAPATEPSK